MPYLTRHGTMKPPLGAQVDPAHPLGQSLVLALLFQHEHPTIPIILSGTAPTTDGGAFNSAYGLPPRGAVTVTGTPTWGSNREGCALTMGTGDYLTVGGATQWVPLTNVTIAIIRRKTDTTNRASALFGVTDNGQASGSGRCGAAVPYSDDIVYWDFDGTAAPGRLTVTGLSFSTVIPERWIFHAGSRGSAIWRNGVKLAEQSTALSRWAGNTDPFTINYGNGVHAGDAQEINYFAMYATQWSDDLCRWWSAEPYAHLYAPPMTYPGGEGAMIAALSAATASSRLSLLGLTGVG